MQLIASYPIHQEVCRSYLGKPVMAVTVDGSTITGVLDRVENGYAYFKPFNAAPNVYTQDAKNHINITNSKNKGKKIRSKSQVIKTRAVAPPYAPPYGAAPYGAYGAPYSGAGPVRRGFGFGLGAGLGFAVPLLLLGSLFLFPFVV